MGQLPFHMAARGDQFGRNCHRDLLRGHRSDVESDRGMYSIKELGRKAFFGQLLKDGDGLAP